jgi:GntR family transcriptional regulator, transcriptional repressor for pyruvate dehydrogenase complex
VDEQRRIVLDVATSGFLPVARQPLSDTVFAQLRDAVLAGRYDPGQFLPPERELAQAFAVNRHAVREALKRLQQAGFVRILHGGGTEVLDVRRTAGLDLLGQLARSPGEQTDRLVRDGLEMRRCVGVEAARLAARRADAAARARVVAAAAALAAVPATAEQAEQAEPAGQAEPAEPAEQAERAAPAGTSAPGDRAFWAEVVDASGNLAFRLAFNSLIDAVDAQPELMAVLLEADRGDGQPHAELARAIAGHDPERAAQTADAILSQALTTLERLSRRRTTRSA